MPLNYCRSSAATDQMQQAGHSLIRVIICTVLQGAICNIAVLAIRPPTQERRITERFGLSPPVGGGFVDGGRVTPWRVS